MKKIALTAAMHASLALAVILTAAALYPYRWFHLYNRWESYREGMRYLSIIRFTYLFLQSHRYFSQHCSIEMVKVAFTCPSTFCINCGINYVLIYGKVWGAEVGTAGAAVGP